MIEIDQKEMDYFRSACEKEGLNLTAQQETQFRQYFDLLLETNKVMNLTAITQTHDVIVKHFIDSLSVVKAVRPEELAGKAVMDMGTGAGFPGIPMKIMFPDTTFVLSDSLNKRIRFLDSVIACCGLKGITTVHARAEELGRDPKHRDRYDYCVSRAVAALPVLCEYCMPFVKPGGCFISYKSTNIDTEKEQAEKAIKVLGGELKEVVRFELDHDDECMEDPDHAYERSLLVIKKLKKTPAAYPRKAGTPKKDPL